MMGLMVLAGPDGWLSLVPVELVVNCQTVLTASDRYKIHYSAEYY